MIDADAVHRELASGDVQLSPEELTAFITESAPETERALYQFGVENDMWEILGHGEKTKHNCGEFRCLQGCLNYEGHNYVDASGIDWRKMAVYKPQFHSCDKPECSECYRKGYCIREANKVESRIAVLEKFWGNAEHVMSMVSLEDSTKPPEELWRLHFQYLRELGVVGSASMFHPAKFDGGVHYEPHFHDIAVFAGGYRCRGCEKFGAECRACHGFESKKFEINKRCGWIFKVGAKRKSVFSTAVYQLSHAAFKMGARTPESQSLLESEATFYAHTLAR